MKKLWIIMLVMMVFLVSCSNTEKNISKEGLDNRIIKVADQYGLAYAPLTILKEKNLISKYDKNLEIEWIKLAGASAIRDAMLSNDLDIGFMGIPPFLIARDNGMEWSIFTALSSSPLGLVSSNKDIKSIKDITLTDKIALPQPGSIQHILLSMAAKRELGDAKYFDKNLVSMKHPDGMSALLSNSDIKLHFTSPPYLFLEENEGMNVILSGNEAFGGSFTFIVGVLKDDILNGKKEDVKMFLNALSDAVKFIDENKTETIDILSKAYNLDKDVIEDYLYNRGMKYSSDVNGLEEFIKFLKENNYIKNDLKLEDVLKEIN